MGIGRLFDRFGDCNCLGDGGAPVTMLLTLDRELHGKDVLTFETASFMVRTGTVGSFGIGADGIAAMTGLRGNKPHPAFFRECTGRGDLLPPVFTFKEFLLDIFL